MLTPIHLLFDLTIYLILKINIISINNIDLLLLLSAELIDLDHLFSKPIYHSQRNPFTTHVLHKNWLIIILVSTLLILLRPTLFFGIGLVSHLLLDYLYIKIYRLSR